MLQNRATHGVLKAVSQPTTVDDLEDAADGQQAILRAEREAALDDVRRGRAYKICLGTGPGRRTVLVTTRAAVERLWGR
jgi:hypothetical protein